MEIRLSDFAITKKAIQILCHKFGQDFIDYPVVFIEEPCRYENGVFYINSNANLAKTMYALFFLYLKYLLPDISDDAKASANNFFLAILRDFKKSYNKENHDSVITMRLNQFPIVWILLKDIICPFQNLTLSNLRVIAGYSGKVDVSRFLTDTDLRETNIPEDFLPFIFVNLDVESSAIQNAYLLVESLRALIPDAKGTPENIIRGLFSDFIMKDKLVSFIKMTLTDEQEESDFFAVLSILCHSKELENLAINHKEGIKEAQSLSRTGPWWFMGLTEKMLEPARSEDWTVREELKPFTQELWTKVERERKKRGLDEVPFEMLLRIQSEDLKNKGDRTLQYLLSDERIW